MSNGDVTKFKEVEKLEVNIAFAKLMYEKDKKEYEEDLKKVYERESKEKRKK